jgi:hypothetical protein
MEGDMPVFISHKQEDVLAAKKINEFLNARGIKTYLDVLDPATRTASDITELVLSRLNVCTHLMAVLSIKSKDSWWIPFEVGAASNAHHRISTYKIEYVTEPEFLTKWPIMSTSNHLNRFIDLYNKDSAVINESLRKSNTASVLKHDESMRFHDTLKQYIRLGY